MLIDNQRSLKMKGGSTTWSKFANGVAHTVCNGVTHTICNGVAHTVCNGVAHTVCNGVAHTVCNGVTHTVCSGVTHTVRNGVTHTVCNGVTHTVCNGVTEVPSMLPSISRVGQDPIYIYTGPYIYVRSVYFILAGKSPNIRPNTYIYIRFWAVPINGPPLSKPNSPNKPILALSPLSLHHYGTSKLHWIQPSSHTF